ncbi:MAG: cupin domain-containing protein [Fidelibacterota bacterium]
MIEYQEDAVVSKILIKKETGNITLFAFDKGQELSEHTAPFDALVQLLEGRAAITISGNINQVKEGEAIVLPANKPHALSAPVPFKMMLVMIRD